MNQSQEPSSDGSLLSCVQSLVQLESSITRSLSQTKPLLDLPTPRNMNEVETILAVARSYSTQTSAPPGWNPNLPVVHFSTPNPLPHQLRKGALGAMQLKMVREERIRKRQRIEQEEKNKKAKMEEERRHAMQDQKDQAKDPKKKELVDHYKIEDDDAKRLAAAKKEKKALLQQQQHRQERRPNHPSDQQIRRNPAAISMNLSDSSSDESDDDD